MTTTQPQCPLDKTTESLKQRIVEFAQSEITPIAQEIDQSDEFPKALWPKMGKLGLLGMTVDKARGGTQSGYLAQTIAVEVISKASASVGLSYGAHANLCVNQIELFGTKDQKTRFLPKLISGEHIGALAMSEKMAGSDVLSMQLTAVEKDDHFVLNGHKMWITNGLNADIIIVYAKTDPDAGAHGITCFIVEANSAGFSTGTKLDKLGMRGTGTCELNFDDCKIPKENVLGECNKGITVLMGGLDIERAVLSAAPLGIMQACLNLVVPYVKQRKQFNKPIGSFELIQKKLAHMYSDLEASQHYVYATARACDNNTVTAKQAAGCYLFAGEKATQIALDTIQCLGGNGYLNNSPAGRLLRDAKLYEIGAGTMEIRELVIARELTKD